jgi:hypothetical protein
MHDANVFTYGHLLLSNMQRPKSNRARRPYSLLPNTLFVRLCRFELHHVFYIFLQKCYFSSVDDANVFTYIHLLLSNAQRPKSNRARRPYSPT